MNDKKGNGFISLEEAMQVRLYAQTLMPECSLLSLLMIDWSGPEMAFRFCLHTFWLPLFGRMK